MACWKAKVLGLFSLAATVAFAGTDEAPRVYTNADLDPIQASPVGVRSVEPWSEEAERQWSFVSVFLEREYARIEAERERAFRAAELGLERERTRSDDEHYVLPYAGIYGWGGSWWRDPYATVRPHGRYGKADLRRLSERRLPEHGAKAKGRGDDPPGPPHKSRPVPQPRNSRRSRHS